MSKGSTRRPQQVTDDAMSDSWSAIFERTRMGLPMEIMCNHCGEITKPEQIHTCSPQLMVKENEQPTYDAS